MLKERNIITLLNFYSDYKLMGLPFAGGWAEQPFWVVDTIRALALEENKIKNEKT